MNPLLDLVLKDAAVPALRFIGAAGEQRFTRAEAHAQIDAFAEHVNAAPRASGRVGVLGRNSATHLLASLAILRAGRCCVLLNPDWPKSTLAAVLGALNLDAVTGDEGALPEGVATVPRLSFETPDRIACAATVSDCDIQGVSAAESSADETLIMFTSGSTGEPKAVPLSGRGYAWTLEQFEFLRPELEGRRVLVAAPLFHMNAQFHTLLTLAFGGTVVLLERFDVPTVLDLLAGGAVDRLTGVPTMFELLARAAEAHNGCYPAVSSIAMGSAPASGVLFERLGRLFPSAVISNGYGTTETGPAIFGVHPQGVVTPPGSVGYPMASVELRLAGGSDPARGELELRSPMVSTGYLGRPDATAERFRDGWYRTGDLMRRDAQGFYFVEGRVDDMFNTGGHNLYPLEVEARLLTHPQVQEAAVVAREDALKGAVPVAFVVVRGDFDEDDLKAHCLAAGPAWAHPRRVVRLDALPLSPVKKIDRAVLKKLAAEVEYRRRTSSGAGSS